MQTMRTEPQAGRMIHIRIPEDVHKHLRVRVAELDTTMQEWVVWAIKYGLEVKDRTHPTKRRQGQ